MGKYYTEQEFDIMSATLKTRLNPEEYATSMSILKEKNYPEYWSENHFFDPDTGITKFKCKPMFVGFLNHNKKQRAGRVGRQTGKTVHMSVDILHTAYYEPGSIILVFCTEKKLMNRILEIMGNLLRQSDLKSSYVLNGSGKKKGNSVEAEYDYEIKVGGEGGSKIRFFFTNINPDKARGQRGTHIYIDEADYQNEKAWPVITGIIKGNKDIKITAISTPKGITTSWYYNFCKKCRENNSEYHLKPTMDPNWPEIEKELRLVIFDEVTWLLEVEAEFVEPVGAVYKKQIIDLAIDRWNISGSYLYIDELFESDEYANCKKYLGVDWNTPQNGVRLVEIAIMFGKMYVTRNEKISYEEFTQIKSVERILELHKKLNYDLITVDAGYGATQVELLIRGIDSIGQNSKDKLCVVDCAGKEIKKIKYHDSELDRDRIIEFSVSIKNSIVDVISKYLELNLCLSKEMDNQQDLIPEIREFRRKPGSKSFMYSDNSHSLSALQFCVYGYDQRATKDKIKVENITVIGSLDTIYKKSINTVSFNKINHNGRGLTNGKFRRRSVI